LETTRSISLNFTSENLAIAAKQIETIILPNRKPL
jgi:hypothetical protein